MHQVIYEQLYQHSLYRKHSLFITSFFVSCNNIISLFYHTHFEITGSPCYLIGSNWCNLFMNRTIFCFKSHHFPSQ